MNSYVNLVARRARRDLPLLAGSVVLTATAVFLTIVGPTLVLQSIDGGAREEVRLAGAKSDIVFETALGSNETMAGAPVGLIQVAEGETIADGLKENLPPVLSAITEASRLTILGPETLLHKRGDTTLNRDEAPRLRVVYLSDENTDSLQVVDGELPGDPAADEDSPLPVAISAPSAEAAQLEVGSRFTVAVTNWRGGVQDDSALLPFEVVSIVESADAAATAQGSATGPWQDTPELWKPLDRAATPTEPAHFRFTVLASAESIARIVEVADDPFKVLVRAETDPAAIRAERSPEIIAAVKALQVDYAKISGASGANLGVTSDLGNVLANYAIQARAALAQMSVLMSSVIGIAGVVLVLLSRLLVNQRGAAIALERARGSSVVSVGLRLLLESAVLAIVGVLIGSIAALIIFGGIRDLFPVAVVALVAALATPVQGMIFALAVWAGKRAPANRKDRQQIVARARARRAVIELSIIALAAAAVYTLRGRGLLTTRADGIDPFLAGAPLLFVIAVTVVVVRLYPWPVRLVTSLGDRSLGVLGVLGAVRARNSIATLPLLALTLGVSLTVGGGLLVDTARGGQVEASWQRIGADMRVTGPVTEQDVEAIRAADGVTAAGAGIVRRGVGVDFGTSSRSFTVVAVDEGWVDVVKQVPGTKGAESLRALAGSQPGDPVPVLIDKETERTLLSPDLKMFYGPASVPLEVVGTSNYAPDGFAEGPFVFVDFEALNRYMPEQLDATTVIVMGEGAADAASETAIPTEQVLSRAAWLDARRSSALVAGVERTMLFSVGAVALLAVVALVATVASGARSRGRDLAMLRTLGMRPRLGWWLALAELAPLVIAAVFGGLIAGIAVILVLAPTLGLEVLAGGTTIPDPVISPTPLIALAGAAVMLLLIGALVDVLVHRRDNLSTVLRVGESV